jgi:hypothetical protein
VYGPSRSAPKTSMIVLPVWSVINGTRHLFVELLGWFLGNAGVPMLAKMQLRATSLMSLRRHTSQGKALLRVVPLHAVNYDQFDTT